MMCNKRLYEPNTNDRLEYKLTENVYDDDFLENLEKLHTNYSSKLANKSPSSTSSISSNTNVSELEDTAFHQPRVNVQTQKDEISVEKLETNVNNINEKVKTKTDFTKNTEYNACDMIDETNNAILEYLTEMSRHEECHPEIDDLLEDTICQDKRKFYKEIENTDKRECCCNCHTNKKIEKVKEKIKEKVNEKVYERDCSIKQIQTPPGTNITIPIYAAAVGPQTYPNSIMWPANNQLNCQNQAMHSNHRPCNRMIHPCCGMHQRPQGMLPTSCRQHPRVCHNQNNDSHSNHKTLSDTLNFQTQLEDESCYNHRAVGRKDNIYRCFTENRQNRVGSPMNWDEIMKYLS